MHSARYPKVTNYSLPLGLIQFHVKELAIIFHSPMQRGTMAMNGLSLCVTKKSQPESSRRHIFTSSVISFYTEERKGDKGIQ